MCRISLKGIPVSPGIAFGRLHIQGNSIIYEKRRLAPGEVEAEIKAINLAFDTVRKDLAGIIDNIPDDMKEYREIAGIQLELAKDPKFAEGIRGRIRRRQICAPWALDETVSELSSLFSDLSDSYLSDRAQDLKALGSKLGNILGGASVSPENCANCVIAAWDMSPADVLQLKLAGVQALLTVEGAVASHAAILARGLKIPALFGVATLFEDARANERVIVDGLSGVALFGPDEEEERHYRKRKEVYEKFERDAKSASRLPARTLDGVEVAVCANLENPLELPGLTDSGAEGIGLYRTEFSYFGSRLPDEESLREEYRAVVESMAPAKVVFRLLDAGADKILPVQQALNEPNPALGLRGIRLCLKRKDIFATQLRAILRACHNANAAVMLPMVSTLEEIDETRAFMEEKSLELRKQGLPHAERVPIGIMLETPAAVMICDALASRCDFFSIGTNDLLHYLMAIDRGNRHVAYLHEPLHQAFIRSLKMAIDAGRKNNISVSVCGELASDTFGIALLLGLGVRELSIASGLVPRVKNLLRKLDSRVCGRLANAALDEFDAAKTRGALKGMLQDALGSELDYHNTLIAN